MEKEYQFVEIIEEIGKSDRTQASRTTKVVCQYLMDYVKPFLPSASSRIYEFSADPNARPLGFFAPAPWELTAGAVSFSSPETTAVHLNHTASPMLVATNSQAFVGNLQVCTSNHESLDGKLVLLTGPKEKLPEQLAAAVQGNAAGVASAAFSKLIGQQEARGRIELPPQSNLFAFSLTLSEQRHLSSALAAGPVDADVTIETNHTGCVPVLEIRTHPESNKEILLCAHICHLRPGANDNASGVAVLCELLRIFGGSLPPVRLIFGPEFTGMSAYLAATGVQPIFVINVDMVGGNPDITGAKLELECSPPYLHHPLEDRIIELLRSSPELNCHVTEFKGYSDHAIFASKAISAPAVMLGQTGDVYNHTDLDKLENLCTNQMAIICRLLAHFLIEAVPYYDIPSFPIPPEQTENTWPFNIHSLLNVCDDATVKDIRSRFAKDKEIYALLQRAYLAAQWNQEPQSDPWAEDVIAKFRQTSELGYGGNHDK
ncbi:DUF4910 domain-containing protein [Vibrio spartinae]|uniref:Peptidase family M28 n=1 Tax=Vibrio spartinae TaxID=1918945 RepID=A0ABX6R3S5_9VIBR|nr:DUF4910 domain-containing protein [Vibrio spartinae]QMV16154.1 Peptidase family M28 [Vibrio spartinae]